MKLILFAYYYPPLAAAGTHRAMRLSNCLANAGWQVQVVTCARSGHNWLDRDLLEDISPAVTVHRCHSFEGFGERSLIGKETSQMSVLRKAARNAWGAIAIPDEKVGWLPFALQKGDQLLREDPNHYVLTTGSPFSAHLIGLMLKRRHGCRWISDFRDPWAGNPYHTIQGSWRDKIAHYLESAVVNSSHRVVLNNQEVKSLYQERYHSLDPERFWSIPNGCQIDDQLKTPVSVGGKFKILYTGEFYGHRTPRHFLEAFRRWLENSALKPENVELEFVGNFGHTNGKDNRELLRELNLNEFVRISAPVSHRECRQKMAVADLLLLIGSEIDQDALFVPAKLYDYLGSRKPILATIDPSGTASHILSETNNSDVISISNYSGIEAALGRRYQQFKRGEQSLTHPEKLLPWSVQRMAERFAEGFQ